MSERTSSQPGVADCNLLFGMLALQMEFISQDRLVATMQAWATILIALDEILMVEHDRRITRQPNRGSLRALDPHMEE